MPCATRAGKSIPAKLTVQVVPASVQETGPLVAAFEVMVTPPGRRLDAGVTGKVVEIGRAHV